MSSASSPFTLSKRTRDDEEVSPSGKRVRTFKLVEPVEQPQSAPPTSNFTTTLAQQRQQALERMEFGAAEREDCEMDCEMDGGNASDSSSASNPRHPWNVVSAPAMAHQTSSNSLSNSSAASSMPTTPLDGQFNYTTSSSSIPSTNYPSRTNPTSFTDMHGNTIHFHDSPAPALAQDQPISNGFVAQAWANAQAKQQQQPQYGWDYPRQSNNFALGGHLV